MKVVALGSPEVTAGVGVEIFPDLWEAGWFSLRLRLLIAAISSYRIVKASALRARRIAGKGIGMTAALGLHGIRAAIWALRLATGGAAAALAGIVLWNMTWAVYTPRRSDFACQVEATDWGALFLWGSIFLIGIGLIILHARWADILGFLRHHGEPAAFSKSPSSRRDTYRALSALQFALDAGAVLDDAMKAAILATENRRVRYQLCFALEMVRDDATLGVGLREAGLLPASFVADWIGLRREGDLVSAVRIAAEDTRRGSCMVHEPGS